jgi:exonuclease VII large subunit
MDEQSYAALVQSTKQFALLAETLERNASAAIEQQQQSTQSLQQTVERTNERMQSTIDSAGDQLKRLLQQAIDQTFAQGMQQFDAAAKAVATDMRQAGESMQKDQAIMAANIKRLTWKLHAVAIVSTLLLVAGGFMLLWQQSRLYDDAKDRVTAAAIDAEIAEAFRQAKVTSCGGRPCVKLDTKARRWGQKGDYVLLDLAAGKADTDSKR